MKHSTCLLKEFYFRKKHREGFLIKMHMVIDFSWDCTHAGGGGNVCTNAHVNERESVGGSR